MYENATARVAASMRDSGVPPSSAAWTAASVEVAKSVRADHESLPPSANGVSPETPPRTEAAEGVLPEPQPLMATASPTSPDVLDMVIHKSWHLEDTAKQGPVDWDRHFDEIYATLSPHLDALCVNHSPLSYSSLCRELQREDLEIQATLAVQRATFWCHKLYGAVGRPQTPNCPLRKYR